MWSVPAAAEPSRGVYAEAGAGATTFVGPKAVYTATGPAFEARVGYDLLSWLSVGVRIAGSSHRATVPPPPSGERFQLYSGGFDLRLGYRYRMVSVFVDGGVGMAMVSTNLLSKVGMLEPGQDNSSCFSAGGGFEYQLLNRHHAFGVGGQWMRIPDFADMSPVTIRAYFRYTH